MSEVVLSPEAQALLRDAMAWRVLGLMFERPRPAWFAQVEALRSEGGAPPELAALLAEALAQADETMVLDILGPGGVVSPRAVGYRRHGDPGQILAQLESVYEAFGFAPDTEECADHVALLAGFMGYLRLKEVYAALGGDTEAAQLTASVARDFLREHLGPLVAGMAARWEGIADALYLTHAMRRLQERVGPAATASAKGLPLPVLEEAEGDAFGCGMPE